MIVAGVLPLLALALIWLWFVPTRDWRYGLLCTGVAGGVLVVMSTEILSLIGQFRFVAVALFWFAVAGVVAVAVSTASSPAPIASWGSTSTTLARLGRA